MNLDNKPCIPGKFISDNDTGMNKPSGYTKQEKFSRKAVDVFDNFHRKIIKYQQDNDNRSPS